MLTKKKIEAIKRIKNEFNDLKDYPDPNVGISVGLIDENNIFNWKCTLVGPKDTPYANGIFILRINFPEDYPETRPEVCFLTPIYHVNVNPRKGLVEGKEGLGHVCISTLNWWRPNFRIREVLTNIFGLCYCANPDSPYGIERAEELRNNKELHDKKVRYFTDKYANMNVDQSIYENNQENWDFTYNQ